MFMPGQYCKRTEQIQINMSRTPTKILTLYVWEIPQGPETSIEPVTPWSQ